MHDFWSSIILEFFIVHKHITEVVWYRFRVVYKTDIMQNTWYINILSYFNMFTKKED